MVRVKHRYLLVHILYPDQPAAEPTASKPPPAASKHVPDVVRFRRPTPNEVTAPVLLREIREQIVQLYGDYGSGVTASSLNIKYFSNATSTFIVRCPRAHYRLVWATVSFMSSLPLRGEDGKVKDRVKCVLRVVRVSGTIRKAEEEAVRRAKADILRATGNSGPEGSSGSSKKLDSILERSGLLKGSSKGLSGTR